MRLTNITSALLLSMPLLWTCQNVNLMKCRHFKAVIGMVISTCIASVRVISDRLMEKNYALNVMVT